MGLRNFIQHCGARLQKPGGQRKRGSVKHILEALSCLNSGAKGASANQMRAVTHSIQTGQTSLHACCANKGLAAHTKVVLFYDLTSMGAGELGDAFISSNKFFNEMKAQIGFFGDVYHVGAYGERWVTWPAWVLNRNVHTRGIEDHSNAPHSGGTDALDELAVWGTADGGGSVVGTVNGIVTYNGADSTTTVYYGDNQTSPTMPPVFSNTEELLVIGFEDEAHCTPNKWADISSYSAPAHFPYGPSGTWVLGGYYDSTLPNQQVVPGGPIATDGSHVTTWQEVAASHSAQVDTASQLSGALALTPNPTNVTTWTDHSGDTANHVYDSTFWNTLGLQAAAAGCVPHTPTLLAELNYTYSFPSVVGALTGTMTDYEQFHNMGNAGTPTVLYQHDYCIAKKVINSHFGNIRYFVYSVPPVPSSRNAPQVMFPLQVLGAMEDGPLGAVPVGTAACTLTNATVSGPYDKTGLNNMIAWGAGFGYNIIDLPCSSAQFHTDIASYLQV